MALTRDELLEVWRSVMPESYTIPLEEENDGRGFDVIAACAAVWARVAAAVETSTQAMYLLPHSSQTAPESAGEAQATGDITLTRSAPADGPLNLKEGDKLSVELATLEGVTIFEIGLELAVDVALAAGSTTPVTVAARAERPGYQGNVEDTQGRSVAFLRRTTATMQDVASTAANLLTSDGGEGDQFDEGMIDAFVVFTGGPNLTTYPRRIASFNSPRSVTVDGPALVAGGNNSLRVVDVNEVGVSAELNGDLTGGVHGWLDELGKERGIGRNALEVDGEYRERIKNLPDLVSPNALQRAARRILEPLGISFRVMESRDPEQFQGAAWDEFPYDNPNTSIFPEDGEQHFWQGNGFEYRGFYVVVERQGYGDAGWPWDIKHPGGVHPSAAWDFMAYDGYAGGFWADLLRLIAEIEKTRAAGVPWLLVLVDSIP
jgi:hypothetical protein